MESGWPSSRKIGMNGASDPPERRPTVPPSCVGRHGSTRPSTRRLQRVSSFRRRLTGRQRVAQRRWAPRPIIRPRLRPDSATKHEDDTVQLLTSSLRPLAVVLACLLAVTGCATKVDTPPATRAPASQAASATVSPTLFVDPIPVVGCAHRTLMVRRADDRREHGQVVQDQRFQRQSPSSSTPWRPGALPARAR